MSERLGGGGRSLRQVVLGRILVVGTMVATTVLLVNIAVSFAADSSTFLRWLAVPVAGILAAVISAVSQWRQPASPEAQSAPQLLFFEAPRRWPRLASALGHHTLTTALAVAVLLIGGGGMVVATATRYGMDWMTGNEHGPDRLSRTTESTTMGLTVTVTKIEQTSHFTRVSVDIDNDTGVAISLPLGEGNALIVAGDGTTRKAEAFRSDWTESIGTGTTRHGVITFNGHLPRDAIKARLIFSRVFGYGEGVPESLTVTGIQLEPPR
jgi:hypothetical protein